MHRRARLTRSIYTAAPESGAPTLVARQGQEVLLDAGDPAERRRTAAAMLRQHRHARIRLEETADWFEVPPHVLECID